MSVIEVKNLSKSFRVHKKEAGLRGSFKAIFKRNWITKNAVRDVSFKIGPGEIVGLIGANGAGKTTLVKMLAGIIYPSAGEASILGHIPWERNNIYRRQMALIMGQKAQLWWDLPAEDCFLLLKEIYQISQKDFQENLAFLSETLGVQSQLNIQIRRLSLGERMKMELVAALLHKPKVVFLDEPTIGLDITAQKAIRKFLLLYRKKEKPAMILTSHYMEDIESLCERVMIIRDGGMVFDGPLKSISQKYAKHKILSISLADGVEMGSFGLPAELDATVLSNAEESTSLLKVKVPTQRVADAAAYILKNFSVSDLNIEGEEIGNIIESIMRNGNRP